MQIQSMNQSEQALEDERVSQLVEQGYAKVAVTDESSMLANLKAQLEAEGSVKEKVVCSILETTTPRGAINGKPQTQEDKYCKSWNPILNSGRLTNRLTHS